MMRALKPNELTGAVLALIRERTGLTKRDIATMCNGEDKTVREAENDAMSVRLTKPKAQLVLNGVRALGYDILVPDGAAWDPSPRVAKVIKRRGERDLKPNG